MKRSIDFAFSLFVIVLFFPLAVPIMIILRLTGEGKVFYRQPRVGKGGETFQMLKFATMLEDSPNLGSGDITLRHDPRVLPFGKFLRKFKINEIPQFINVLKGQMSLVGPRPLTPKNFAMYPDRVKQIIGTMVPGVTGIGSIVFRDEESIIAKSSRPYLECYREEIAPYKGDLEAWYKEYQTAWIDLKIILLTVWAVVFPRSTVYETVFPDLPPRRAFCGVEQAAPNSSESEIAKKIVIR